MVLAEDGILPSHRRKQELNSFIAGGMKELLGVSVKQGGESSLAMSVFPCLPTASVEPGGRFTAVYSSSRSRFSLFSLLEQLKFIRPETCRVKLTGKGRYGYFEGFTFIFMSHNQHYLLLLLQI